MSTHDIDPKSILLADKFGKLLDSAASEEEVHRFFNNNLEVFGTNRRSFRSDRLIAGILSKFPVATDRVPDFTIARVQFHSRQLPNELIFVELKKPNAQLYVQHGRLSKDLNDAWMESLDTVRLIAMNYQDVLRRIVKQVSLSQLSDVDALYNTAEHGDEVSEFDNHLPECRCFILIGRRSSLGAEGIMRTRELSASTGHAIRVLTYDFVLEAIKDGRGLFPEWW